MAKKPPNARQKLKRLRESLHMTQRVFGLEIGRSERAVQDYEAGRLAVPTGVEKLIDYIIKEREAANA